MDASALQLHKGEKLLLELSPQPKLATYILFSRGIFAPILPLYFLLMIAFVVFSMTAKSAQPIFDASGTTWATWLLIVILLYIIMLALIKLWCNVVASKHKFIFTNQRCILYWGYWGVSKKIIPYSRIADVYMRQNPLRAMTGIAAVFIEEINAGVGIRSQRSQGLNIVDGLTMDEAEQVMNCVSEHMTNSNN